MTATTQDAPTAPATEPKPFLPPPPAERLPAQKAAKPTKPRKREKRQPRRR